MKTAQRSCTSVAIAAAISASLVAAGSPTFASSGPIYTVMNTSETPPDGVYFRNSPNWNDTSRTYGLGVFMNEQVQLECYAFGQAIGPYNDSLWYYVVNVTRPVNYNGAANQGMLNAHYINDGQIANVVDAGVPACVNNLPPNGSPNSPTPPPPASTASVALAQGPAAPSGYRYAITLSAFAAGATVTVTCADSVNPNGFYNFTLTTDGGGGAFTQSYCYSADGPDHWVIANGNVESNHVAWGSSVAPGGTPPGSSDPGNSQPTTGITTGPAAPTTTTPVSAFSVFYSPNATPTGLDNISGGDLNLTLDNWAAGNCQPTNAASFPGSPATLAGWSKGRLGPLYFLMHADTSRVAQVRTIILFDPGSTSDFAKPSTWASLFGDATCDWHFDINSLLASWLSSNPSNHLLVLTGKDSEEKSNGKATYAGLWKYYFAGIWNQPFAQRAQICDYDNMSHQQVLSTFSYIIKSPPSSCPSGPALTPWNP